MNINLDTIRFLAMIDDWKDQSTDGIVPFSDLVKQAKEDNFPQWIHYYRIAYDDTTPLRDLGDELEYPLVADFELNECDQTIATTWTDIFEKDNIKIVVRVPNEDGYKPYIYISEQDDDEQPILIENGNWRLLY